jgi:hypothetical protein
VNAALRITAIVEANLLGCAAGRSFARFASFGFLFGFEILAGLLIDHLH